MLHALMDDRALRRRRAPPAAAAPQVSPPSDVGPVTAQAPHPINTPSQAPAAAMLTSPAPEPQVPPPREPQAEASAAQGLPPRGGGGGASRRCAEQHDDGGGQQCARSIRLIQAVVDFRDPGRFARVQRVRCSRRRARTVAGDVRRRPVVSAPMKYFSRWNPVICALRRTWSPGRPDFARRVARPTREIFANCICDVHYIYTMCLYIRYRLYYIAYFYYI